MDGVNDEDLAVLFREAMAGDEKAYCDFLQEAARLVRGLAGRFVHSSANSIPSGRMPSRSILAQAIWVTLGNHPTCR